MNDAAAAVAQFRAGAIDEAAFQRRLIGFEDWRVPLLPAASGVFEFDSAQAYRDDGPAGVGILLFTGEEGEEAFRAEKAVRGEQPVGVLLCVAGTEIFGADLSGPAAIVIDPGAASKWCIEADAIPAWRATAAAIAVEAAWRRLHAGDEEPGDLALAARHPGYYVAVVRKADEVRLVHAPYGDGRFFAAVFTHADALDLALAEMTTSFAPVPALAPVLVVPVDGARLFPMLRKEEAAGVVLNCRGPTDPLTFELDVVDLLLVELNNGASGGGANDP